ncbi:34772_t:CDS:1, partial [Gigaspora margarita]
MLLKKILTIIVLLALTGVESTIPSNIISDPPSKDNVINVDDITGNLSARCETALVKIFTGLEFLACVPIQALLSLVPIISEIENIKKNPRELLQYLGSIDQFSNGICLSPKYSDKGVQSVIQTIENECITDLNNNNTFVELIFSIAVFYSPLRDSICFKNNDVFCIHETADITLNYINGNNIIDAIAVADPEHVCTQCNKDIINTFDNFLKNNPLALQALSRAGFNQTHIDTVKTGVAVKCGIKFE